MLRGVLPRMRDAAGRYYLELSPPPRSDGSGNRESVGLSRVKTGQFRVGPRPPAR